MQVIIVNGDVESLASMLNQTIDDAYVAGQQAERERIKAIIREVTGGFRNCDRLMEKIDATTE